MLNSVSPFAYLESEIVSYHHDEDPEITSFEDFLYKNMLMTSR